jgi:hypothetical protein
MVSNEQFMNIMGYMAFAISIVFVLIIGLNCVWIDHQTITIEVKEKIPSPLSVISQTETTYIVRSNIDYAKLHKGKIYEVSVAHNPFIGAGWMNKDGTWNIDNVVREVV